MPWEDWRGCLSNVDENGRSDMSAWSSELQVFPHKGTVYQGLRHSKLRRWSGLATYWLLLKEEVAWYSTVWGAMSSAWCQWLLVPLVSTARGSPSNRARKSSSSRNGSNRGSTSDLTWLCFGALMILPRTALPSSRISVRDVVLSTCDLGHRLGSGVWSFAAPLSLWPGIFLGKLDVLSISSGHSLVLVTGGK